MLKKIVTIFTLLTAIIVLSACKPSSDNQSTSADTTNTDIPTDTLTSIIEDSAPLYTIIRAEDASDIVISNMQKLKEQLDKEAGVYFTLGTDWYRDGDTTISDKYEILVGKTDRPEYDDALSKLKYNDYSITKIGNKIVIAAYTDDNLTKAVNYFIKNVPDYISTDDNGKVDLIVPTSWFYTFSTEYDFLDINIGNISIKDYKIIVSKNAKVSELNVAAEIQELIAKKCGFVVPLFDDTENSVANEILIGNTNRNQSTEYYNSNPNVLNYIIKADSSKLVLAFGGYTSSVNSITEFEKLLDENSIDKKVVLAENLNINITLDLDYLPSAELATGADVRIMSTNVLFDQVDISLRAEIFADYYKIYKPDSIGLQEMILDWQDALFPLVSDMYAVCCPMPSDGVFDYTPILYLKDKYTLIESGVTRFRSGRSPWLVTWAVLEDKQTGQRYIHCNTHYSVVSANYIESHPTATDAVEGVAWRLEDCAVVKSKVLELQAKYNGIPAVITGDFNSTQYSAEYALMIKNTDIRMAMLVASISSMKEYRSYHTLGVDDRKSNDGKSIDHVLVTTNTVNVYVHKIIYDDIIIQASDHCPVYADISFK